jgi:hypothetical protein
MGTEGSEGKSQVLPGMFCWNVIQTDILPEMYTQIFHHQIFYKGMQVTFFLFIFMCLRLSMYN